ncbi:DUF6082 family protein [Kitasatospora sp. NPDC048298]|uniref:DUF6082 family protein n=1 Tax=Kitasatospora sp. NPDC048298 TaxID=3364049 RepID=UPI00371CC4B1
MMRTAHAVLLGAGLLAGIGAVRLVVDHRHQYRQLSLAAANMHQRLMSDGEAHPERYADHPTLGQLPSEERAQAIHTNRVFALLAAKHRAGLLPDDELHHGLEDLVHHPSAIAFWKRSGNFWLTESEAGDKAARRFGKALARTFERATDLRHAA